MAFPLYSIVRLAVADRITRITVGNAEWNEIPLGKDNLVYEMAQVVFAAVGVEIPELDIYVNGEIPLTRGLGSSAAAIVGALVAANELIGAPLTREELFLLATRREGHPDNVAPSLFGGIVVSAYDGEHLSYVPLAPPPQLEALLAIPRFALSTAAARRALPSAVPLGDAVFNLAHAAVLAAGLAAGRLDVLRQAMIDRLHQPYRAALVPGMAEILQGAPAHGALGVALSGAGPTLLAVCDAQAADHAALETYMRETFAAHGVTADMRWMRPTPLGAEVTVTTR
jgi:homoserine kinase